MGWGVNDYPTPPEYNVPVCPICGNECSTLYRDSTGIIGCENCVTELDAWEEMYNKEVQ